MRQRMMTTMRACLTLLVLAATAAATQAAQRWH
jgi:hypothetical protein